MGSSDLERDGFCESFNTWLGLLQQAGYDLHEYVCAEYDLCPTLFAGGEDMVELTTSTILTR